MADRPVGVLDHCPYCEGEECALCEHRHRPWEPPCDHDTMERHGDRQCLYPEGVPGPYYTEVPSG